MTEIGVDAGEDVWAFTVCTSVTEAEAKVPSPE